MPYEGSQKRERERWLSPHTSRPSRRAVFTEYPTDETGQEDHDMVVVTQQVLDPAILIILCNMFNNNL